MRVGGFCLPVVFGAYVVLSAVSLPAVAESLSTNRSFGSPSVAAPFRQCGDGIAAPGEGCDPGDPSAAIPPDFRGETCQSLGYSGGELACTAPGPDNRGCQVDASGCECRTGPPAPPQRTGQILCYALCANVLETPSLKEFTDEGGEDSVDGSTA
jgi:hypothetical protein